MKHSMIQTEKQLEYLAFSSNDLDKYEYLTVEDLGVEKPSSVEKAKFDYSLLGKIFNKRRRLKEEDEKEGLLKRLKNIEDKNEEQLRVVKNETENIKEVTDFVKESSSLEVKGLIQEIKVIQRDVDYRKVKIRGGNKVEYDFSDYKTLKELFRDLYYRKTAIDDAEAEQEEFGAMIGVLNKYPAKKTEYIEAKNKLLINVKKFYKGRKKIIEGLKTEIFSINCDEIVKEQARYKEEEKNIRNENGLIDY